MKKQWIALAALVLSLFPLQAQESESTSPRILGFHCYYAGSDAAVTALDVSGCTSLTELRFDYFSSLTSLDASGCTALTRLSCLNSKLTRLNVSGCTALTHLFCHGNDLKSLDISGCTSLKNLARFGSSYRFTVDTLKIHGMAMDTLIIHDSWNLEEKNIKVIDASGCTTLKLLDCSGPHYSQRVHGVLEEVNVSGCTSLTDLDCTYNQLTNLNVSGCTSLTDLDCRYNQLTNLNVSGCTSLTDLDCPYNQLTNLNVSGCTSLERLNCDNNQLTSLDVSGNISLKGLSCDNNQLTSLDVSGNISLEGLSCDNNQLTSLDVSGNISLEGLSCSDNDLTSLDIEKTSLGELSCGGNRIPLSMLYKEHCWVSGNQSDSIVLQVGETFDLSSERIVEQVLSTYELTDVYDQEVDSSFWEETQFEFQFLAPLTYTLKLQNPKIEELRGYDSFHFPITAPITFTWHILVTEVQYYTIKVMSSNTEWGTVSVTGNGTYEEGGEVAITAQSYEGYRFVNWTKADGAVFSTEAFYTFTVDENLELTANFEKEPNDKETFTVTLASNNTEWGRVSMTGNGNYEKDETVTITATPNEGYHFVNWTKADGAVFSTEATYTFVVTEDLELTAYFEKIPDGVGNEALGQDNFRVYAQDRVIYLSADRGKVEVYNALGQCVYSGHATAIPVRNGGLYIVRIGRNSYKVMVR